MSDDETFLNLQNIIIDETVPRGYAKIGGTLIKLPEPNTYTSKDPCPIDLEAMKTAIQSIEPKKKYPVFVEGELRGFARFQGDTLIVPVKDGEDFFINIDNPIDDMPDETKVVFDGLQLGTCADVHFEERRAHGDVENLISPESIQALQNAFHTMQEALKSLGESLNEALVDVKNENHETVMKLIEEIDKQPVININRTRKEVKLPRKLRNGWA